MSRANRFQEVLVGRNYEERVNFMQESLDRPILNYDVPNDPRIVPRRRTHRMIRWPGGEGSSRYTDDEDGRDEDSDCFSEWEDDSSSSDDDY